jgi:hypothetical protein
VELNHLLKNAGISLDGVLIMRHRPNQPELNKVLPWLASEQPDIFNAYQQTQTGRGEGALKQAEFLASFIGHEPGKAVFVGLFKVDGSRPITFDQYWKIPAYRQMKAWGHSGFAGDRPSILWFDLTELDFHRDWKGKLIVRWPPPERSWFRWAEKARILVDAILDESQFVRALPDWSGLVLTWDELRVLPRKLQDKLREWRGVYFIYDVGRGKGYVGSAYGADNIYGRWLNYAKSGHGGNKLLRQAKPSDLRFSILERVSPDLDSKEVTRIESTWKIRLLTREYGLNQN